MEQGKRERWSVVPDGLFGLSFADGTAAYFLLELDRGTIPISRRAGDHRSIRRKLKTYYDGWRAQRHLEQFGVKQMRVLTVTSSRERVHNMVGAVRSITEGRGSNFFLFVDRGTLAASNPLRGGVDDWEGRDGEVDGLMLEGRSARTIVLTAGLASTSRPCRKSLDLLYCEP